MNSGNNFVIAIVILSISVAIWISALVRVDNGHSVNAEKEPIISVAMSHASDTNSISGHAANGIFSSEKLPVQNTTDSETKAEQINRLIATGHPADALSAFRLAAHCFHSRNDLHDRMTTDDQVNQICGNISGNQIAARSDYLDMALKAKVPGAATAFLQEGPIGGDLTALASRPTDPLIIDWKHKAIRVLIDASNEGDVDSLNQLSTIYHMGTLAEKNIELALTYEIARQDILKSQGKLTPAQAKLGDRLSAVLAMELSPEQIASATNNGKRMAIDCCNKTQHQQ